MKKYLVFLFLVLSPLRLYSSLLYAEDWTNTLSELESEEPLLAQLLREDYQHYRKYLETLPQGNFTQKLGREFVESLAITGTSTLAAVAYGISMDMITAHLCMEYFSTGFHDDNLQYMNPGLNEFLREAKIPSLYALTWGPIASWWVGLPLGLPLAWSSRTDLNSPQYGWKDLLPKLGITLGTTLAVSLANGLGYYLDNPQQDDLTRRYDTAAAIHQSAYTYGALFGLSCAVWIYIERNGEAKKIAKERDLFLRQILGMQTEGLIQQRENFDKLVLSTLE